VFCGNIYGAFVKDIIGKVLIIQRIKCYIKNPDNKFGIQNVEGFEQKQLTTFVSMLGCNGFELHIQFNGLKSHLQSNGSNSAFNLMD
jgi:hypothetical protein